MVAQFDQSTGALATTQSAKQNANCSMSLTPQQHKEAASVLGQAFYQDSFMAYVLPDATTRVQKLSHIFLPLIRIGDRHGNVIITPGGGGSSNMGSWNSVFAPSKIE